MPGIKGHPTVEVCDPVALFGQVVYPEESIGETMREAAIGTTTSFTGCRVDSATDLLTLSPKYDVRSMRKSDWSCAGGTVTEITDRATGKTVLAQTAAPKDAEWNATAGASMSGAIIPAGGGWWFGLGKSAPLPGSTESYLRIELATTGTVKLRLDWDAGKHPCVLRFDGTTWTKAGDIPMDATKSLSGAAARAVFLVQLLDVYTDRVTGVVYGKLAIRAGQGGDWNDKALVLGYHEIGFPVVVRGRNVNASWIAGPVSYEPSGSMMSGVKEKSSGNDSPYTVYVTGTTANGQLDGIGGSAWSVANNPYACQYQLDLTAKSGSVYPDGTPAENSVTPWVRSVVVQQESVQVAPAMDPGWTPIGYVEHVHTESEFVPGDNSGHTVAAFCDVTLRNQEGQQAGPTGAKAMRVVGNLFDEYGRLLWSQGLFLGFVNLRSRINPWSMVSEGVDRSVQLRAKKIHLDMYGDGQCVYHFAKRLAQRGGITDAWLHLAPNNPADAWTCDGFTCDHPRLPMGTAAEPLVRIPSGTSVWDALGLISQGYVYGFTVDGQFTFYSWEPWTARDDWKPRQVFSMVPEIDWNTGLPALNEILDGFEVTIDLTNTRNVLNLIGWDKASWLPFVVRRYDPDGVAGGYGTARYQGFLNEWAWSDAMFCDPTFTDAVANRVFNWVSQPEVTAQFRCWPLPLYALDYIGILANRAFPYDEKWWCRKVTQDWDAHGEYRMDILAGLVPQGLTASAVMVAASTDSGAASTLGTTDENGNPTAFAAADQPRTGTSVAAPAQGDTFQSVTLAADAYNAETTTTVAPHVFAANQLITADRLNTHAQALEALMNRMAPRWTKTFSVWLAGEPTHTAILPVSVAPGYEDSILVSGPGAEIAGELSADRTSITFRSPVVPQYQRQNPNDPNSPVDVTTALWSVDNPRDVVMTIAYMAQGGAEGAPVWRMAHGTTPQDEKVSVAVLDVPVKVGMEGRIVGFSSNGDLLPMNFSVSEDRLTITHTWPEDVPYSINLMRWLGGTYDWCHIWYIPETSR